MAIPKYKDPITGKWNRITTYGQSGNPVEITEISGETALSDDIITELKNDLNWISYGSGAYRFVSAEEDKRLYSYITEDKISQILVNTLTKTCVLRETQITAASVADSIVKRDSYGEIPVSTPSRDSSATNKAYVDEADKDLRLKLSNLEQALNGYVLDTTKEAYADLDSAVLKNSVAVGDNVYPIADKTRALVTRIDGKTTKMVQLLDKSTYSATQTKSGITATNNGDGSWTINGTATKNDYINFSAPLSSIIGGHKILICGNKENSNFSMGLLNQPIKDTGAGAIGTFNQSAEKNWGIEWVNGAVINNVTITPQLFDLTAMNREDITTAEQFKAEFPDLYPYENGNIYPAKISGVKFYEKQDKSGEQASVTFPQTYDLHGIGDYKDYLEITKNEDNELYTLKKIQQIENKVLNGTETVNKSGYVTTNYQSYYISMILLNVNNGLGGICNKLPTATQEKNIAHITFGINNIYPYLFFDKETYATVDSVKAYLAAQYAANDPLIIYYIRQKPVETVIAKNLTYEQVTAIRHNGGLIEVEDNTNKAYARPTVTNTIVYRLTAANTAEV
jgi:hypothetical protein